jgi:Tol biopolymer transport system component
MEGRTEREQPDPKKEITEAGKEVDTSSEASEAAEDLTVGQEVVSTAGKDPHLHVSKKKVLAATAVFLLIFLGLAAWKLKWYQPLADRYNASAVSLKVREGDKFSVEGAQISVDGKSAITDHNGNVALENIPAGTYQLSVSKDGYVVLQQAISLHRGDNGIVFLSLAKNPAKLYTVKGFVKNAVSDQPIADVQVTLGSKTVATDPTGAYSFSNVAPSDVSVTLSKAGFTDKQLAAKVVDADIVSVGVTLVPTGQLVFVSNRDGHRALYSSLYDGSGQRPFAVAPGGAEDFAPIISPDNKTIVFMSYRDGAKDAYGNKLATLYQVGADGKDPKKISNDVLSAPTALWSPSGQYVYYGGFTSSKLDTATYKVYDTQKSATIDIGEPATGLVFSPDSKTVAYVVSSVENRIIPATPSPSPSPSPTPEPVATATPSPSPSPIPSAVPLPTTSVTINTVKTINLATGERKAVIKKDQYVSSMRFGPDNRSVSYQVIVGSVLHQFTVALADGKEGEISLVPYNTRRTILSPNGQSQAFVEERDGKKDLFLMDANGKNEKRLTTLGVLDDAVLPHFDDSGAYITVAVKREGENALYLVALEGGDPKKVTDYYYDSSHS